MSKILLINDMPGYGKVALAAMLPVIGHMGHETYTLPTALVSNTLDWGKFDILPTDQYMLNTMKVWDELGFEFDAVSTGFITSENQAEIIADYCVKQRSKGVKVFADPIMGDEGKLYNSVTDKTVERMRKLISVAEFIVPNYTEAAALSGHEYKSDGISFEEFKEIALSLHKIGAKNVIITSAKIDGESCTAGYDSENDEYFAFQYKIIKGRFIGTGDIFSALLTGYIMNGEKIQDAVKKAMNGVSRLIEKNVDNEEVFKGLKIEEYLDEVI